MATGRKDYEERKEDRINRYEERAQKAAQEAEAQGKKGDRMADAIPFGQPILVGHHSEGRDRAFRNKIDTAFHKSVAASEKADYYQEKAETASSNRTISGDNPEAVNLYQKKLEKLEAAQEEMKSVNKAYKKGDAALKDMGMDDVQIANMRANIKKSHPWDNKPFPTWALSNNSAEIRRIKEKIEQIGRLDKIEEEEALEFDGGELRFNTDINRCQFVFDSIPSEAIRTLLKSNGFKWAPSEKAWQRQRTLNGISASKRLVAKIKELSENKE
jgi:hypothetical protein